MKEDRGYLDRCEETSATKSLSLIKWILREEARGSEDMMQVMKTWDAMVGVGPTSGSQSSLI